MEYRLNVNNSWKLSLEKEFLKDYYIRLLDFLKLENSVSTVFPPSSEVFSALNSTPLKEVKVVIIGQDPYHGENQAMGLSFSVPKDMRIPPSLKNIYKELNTDVGIEIPSHGDLTQWAEQGVFLLNAMLTVERGKAGSHKKIGWQNFTDAVIKTLSNERDNLIFMLWGNFAKKKAELIDNSKHLILEAAHPSPLARGTFFGSQHFSKANAYLMKMGKKPIDWSLD